MAIKIEHGVPIPERRGGRGYDPIYPFAKMNVGDSVFILDGFKGRNGSVASRQIQNSAYAYGKANGKMFTTRTLDGGVRIWRVA